MNLLTAIVKALTPRPPYVSTLEHLSISQISSKIEDGSITFREMREYLPFIERMKRASA